MSLTVQDLHTYYGESHILQGISLRVEEGEVVSLLGRNGAGKTTTIRSILGLTPARRGELRFREWDLRKQPPHALARLGIRYVPQGRRIFPLLSVEENLRLALVGLDVDDGEGEMSRIYAMFPRLKERRRQKAGLLSGGEQQMLAIGRALLGRASLLLLDEPTEGLAPVVVKGILQIIADIARQGVAILLAEQNVKFALRLAARHYIIDKGRVEFEGSSADLEENTAVVHRFLGVSARGVV